MIPDAELDATGLICPLPVLRAKKALKPLLAVPDGFALRPSIPPPWTDEDRLAQRVLATDNALRDLLAAAAGAGAPQETPAVSTSAAAAGVPAGMAYEALRNKYFAGNDDDLRVLGALLRARARAAGGAVRGAGVGRVAGPVRATPRAQHSLPRASPSLPPLPPRPLSP
jgi:hypothetical protein